MTNKKSPISKWTDFDVFVGTKKTTAKTSDPSLKGSVSLQYFLGRSGGTTWLGCVTRWQQLVTAPAQHNEEVTKNWGWRSWRFLLLFPIISSIYIYTHTSCVQDVLVYGIRRRASKGHVSKLPRYGTRTYHDSLSNLNYVDFPSCHPPFLTLVQHPAGRTDHIPCILHVPAEIISCTKWYWSDFTNNEKTMQSFIII